MSEYNKRQHLFSLQKMNKYFLMPFFIPIICFTTKFFSERMKTDGRRIDIRKVTSDDTNTFTFLYQIIQSICLILGGLLYFISLIISRSQREILNSSDGNDDSTNNSKKMILKNVKTKKLSKKKNDNIKKVLLIIFMPLLLIIYNIGIAFGVEYPQLEKRVYFLLFFTLINIFFLKKKIYKHQKLSLIIIAIGAIPIYLAFFLHLDTDLYNPLYDIFLLVGSLCYSLYLVFIKYLTCDKGMSVLLLLLYQGLLCTAYTIIIFGVMSLINKGDFTYIYNIFHCTEINYICISHYRFKIAMYFILNTALQTLLFLVIYHFSPELFAISDIFSPLFSYIDLCIEGRETNGLKIFLTILGYLIMTVASFIYNEIVVLNFWGLDKDTWKSIDYKAYKDVYGIDEIDSFAVDGNYFVEAIIPPGEEEHYDEMTQY